MGAGRKFLCLPFGLFCLVLVGLFLVGLRSYGLFVLFGFGWVVSCWPESLWVVCSLLFFGLAVFRIYFAFQKI